MTPGDPNQPTHFLDWRDEWQLDVGFMDEDHHHMAVLLNRIARDYAAGPVSYGIPQPDAAPLADALTELADQTRVHFRREEEAMRVDAYPGLAEHTSEHNQLLAELSLMIRELRDSGTERLDQVHLDALKDWLVGHVLEQDRAFADFLKSTGPEDSPKKEH